MMENFKIAQPKELNQTLGLLNRQEKDFYLMAGGTDLLDEIKNEIIKPEIVIDLNSIPDLSYIIRDKNRVRIGALTTVSDIADSELIKNEFPVLHEAALSLASPQIRNVGTLGGNLCQRPRCWYYRNSQFLCWKKGGNNCYAYSGKNKYHAIFGEDLCFIVHPSDLAPALICLGAEVTVGRSEGDKTLSLDKFFTKPAENSRRENILEPTDVLKEIKIPFPKTGEKSTYFKIKERETWDFAVVSAAVRGKFTGNKIDDIKITLGGVAPIPWKLEKAEKYLKRKNATEETIRIAAREGLSEANPLSENEYKIDLAEAVLIQTILSLTE